MKTYPRVLVIAGSDSGGGAGIQADIKAVAACGAYAATAITALTIQNTLGVRGVHVPPAGVVEAQIDAVMEDIGADAVKIGMLPNVEIVHAVTRALKRHAAKNIVLDPVMVATSGDQLIDDQAVEAIIEQLVPMAALVTPNLSEAVRMGEIAAPCLLKGGHSEAEVLTDVFNEGRSFSHARIVTPNTHGTGCTLASAIAAYLAQGQPLTDAIAHAEEYLQGAIRAGAEYTLGSGHGPVQHFYRFHR